jgi:hypothetical protein
MVKKFFEGIKDDIKDTIVPPKKALIVVDESSGPIERAKPVNLDNINSDTEGFIREPENVVPLKALPVEPIETGGDPDVIDENENTPPVDSRPIKALPVGDDEFIEEGAEEP